MINLLPDDTKRDIKAARMNVTLLRYNFFTALAVAGLALACLAFYAMLGASQSLAISKSNDNSIKAESFNDIRKQADEYRANLAIANKVLGNSVNYTSVIFTITKLLPSGVVLDSLNLNAADFGQQTTFSARAKSYADATRLKESFQNSKVFTNVYLQSLTDSSSEQGAAAYPVTVVISAKLNKAELQ